MRNFKYNLIHFYLLLFTLFLFSNSLVAEEKQYVDSVDDASSFNISTTNGSDNDPIEWSHTIPEAILDKATKVKLVIDAFDVDYPANAENDRLYINGKAIGLLEGKNNTWVKYEKMISPSILKAGENAFSVDNEVDRWVLKIRLSELTIYYNSDPIVTPEPEPEEEFKEIKKLSVKLKQDSRSLLPDVAHDYSVTIENTGNVVLSDIEVSDTLDRNLKFVETNAEADVSVSGQEISIKLKEDLEPGKKVQFKIKTKTDTVLTSGARVENRVFVEAKESEEVFESNRVVATTTFLPILPEEVSLKKTVNSKRVKVGGFLKYSVDIVNDSRGVLFNLKLKDFTPGGMQYVKNSVQLNNRSFDEPQGSRTLSWDIPPLAAGSSYSLSYTLVAGPNISRGNLTNKVRLTGKDGGGSSINKSASVTVRASVTDLVEYGSIEVSLFVDSNDNGRRDFNEEALPGVKVYCSQGEKKFSDKDGVVFFGQLLPRNYAVSVNLKKLREIYEIKKSTQLVRVLEGSKTRLRIPILLRGSDLEGKLYWDKNANNQFDFDEQPIANVIVSLDSYEVVSDFDGFYSLKSIPRGKYKMDFSSASKDSLFTYEVSSDTHVRISSDRKKQTKNIGFKPILGKVEGIVFLDKNRNNQFDKNETVTPNVIVRLKTNSKVSQSQTDNNGRFRFLNISAGEATLSCPLSVTRTFSIDSNNPVQVNMPQHKTGFLEIGVSKTKKKQR